MGIKDILLSPGLGIGASMGTGIILLFFFQEWAIGSWLLLTGTLSFIGLLRQRSL